MFEIFFSTKANKEFNKIDITYKEQVRNVIKVLSIDPIQPNSMISKNYLD